MYSQLEQNISITHKFYETSDEPMYCNKVNLEWRQLQMKMCRDEKFDTRRLHHNIHTDTDVANLFKRDPGAQQLDLLRS